MSRSHSQNVGGRHGGRESVKADAVIIPGKVHQISVKPIRRHPKDPAKLAAAFWPDRLANIGLVAV